MTNAGQISPELLQGIKAAKAFIYWERVESVFALSLGREQPLPYNLTKANQTQDQGWDFQTGKTDSLPSLDPA